MKIPHPHRLHIVGPKKSGKTNLLEHLIQKLTARGYRVGAFKHSTHHHPIDKIGSDSDRLRRAGGDPSLFHSQEGMAVFFNSQNSDREEHVLSMLYTDCDLVLVESFCSASGPKIVIINGEEELAELTNVIAVVNKSGRHPDFPAFSHDDPGLVEFIVQRMLFKALQG